MSRLKKIHFSMDGSVVNELSFDYDIYVNQEGEFTTTIPKEITDRLLAANIDLGMNRRGVYGYFADISLDGLIKQIKEVVSEFLSRELIEEKIVLRYKIDTVCSYCIDEKGELQPNGVGIKNYKWSGGTVDTHASKRAPYGINVYIDPCRRRVYQYKSGNRKIEYGRISLSFIEHDNEKPLIVEKKEYPNLFWLDRVVAMSPLARHEIYEIDYTEKIGEFFVSLIKSIFKMNESIKDYLDPESIKELAESGKRLLLK